MGYKDGVHDGRESQFQVGFDVGYQHGFKYGFLLGKFKGCLSIEQAQAKEENKSNLSGQNDLMLQRPSRGQCILCTNPSLKDESIGDIVIKQTEQMGNIESTLESNYVTK